MKIKKLIIIFFLIVIVALVWIFNLKFISRIKSQRAEMKPIISTSLFSAESLEKSDFKFSPIKRDPFNIIVDTGPKEPVMPLFSLKGVVITDNGALALMELSDGNVYPMKQGEKYLGVKIKKITSKQVTAEFRGRKTTFTVLQ